MIDVIILLISAIFWGIICWLIGRQKGISGFWWGFFLGIIGVIVVACSKDKTVKNDISCMTNMEYEDLSSDNNTSFDKYASIEKLNELKKSGAITEEEFNNEKSKILEK